MNTFDWVGLAGLIISLINLAYLMYERHVNINIDYSLLVIPETKDYSILEMVLTNRSALNISIVSAQIYYDGSLVAANDFRGLFYLQSGSQHNVLRVATQVPFQIPAHTSERIFLQFSSDQSICHSELNQTLLCRLLENQVVDIVIQFQTSRCKVVCYTSLLGTTLNAWSETFWKDNKK